MTSPRVSVIVPTRDRLPLLRRALAGVEAQRFRDFELIVVDDGSADGTGDWLRARADVRLVATGRPAGAAAARNLGLGQARGELVAFLDDDDVWLASYLEAQVARLDAAPEVAVSYAGHVQSDAAGRVSVVDTSTLLPDGSPLVRLLAESPIHTMSAVVCRRDAFERFGRFDERLSVVHDLDWYARVVVGGGRIGHLPRTLVERSVPGGLVVSHREWFREEREIVSRALAAGGEQRHERLVRAYRSLFFAQLALARGDVTFAAARLGGAFVASPHWSLRLVALSLLRRARRDRQARGWEAATEVAP